MCVTEPIAMDANELSEIYEDAYAKAKEMLGDDKAWPFFEAWAAFEHLTDGNGKLVEAIADFGIVGIPFAMPTPQDIIVSCLDSIAVVEQMGYNDVAKRMMEQLGKMKEIVGV